MQKSYTRYPCLNVKGRIRLALTLVTVTSCLLLTFPLNAQYDATKWTIEDGLPDSEVRGLAQTPDGYLWIATLNGLARFDGIRFTVFNKANSPGIVSNRLTSLFQGSDGDLWAPYEVRGLLRVHMGSFRTYGVGDGINDATVSTVTGDSSGHVWVVSKGQIQNWDRAHDRFANVSSLNERLYGPLSWGLGAGTHDNEHAYCFARGALITYLLPKWLQKASVRAIAVDEDRIAWVETLSGHRTRLAPGDPTKLHELPTNDSSVFRGHAGQLWTFKVDRDLKRSIEVSMRGVRSSLRFNHVIADREGNLWAGAEDGLYRLQSKFINVYTVEQGLLDRDVYPVYQDHAGAVWIGAWNKGLSRFENGRFVNYTTADGLPNRWVTALHQDQEGRLWVGTHGGVTVFEQGRLQTPPVPPFREVVQAIYQDRSGFIWFAQRSGLARWRDGSPFETLSSARQYLDIHVIAQSANGDLWFGGSMGLTQMHGNVVMHWTEENGVTTDNVWSLYPDSDGTLWIGTYDGGLLRLKDEKLTRFTKRDGLFSDGVFQILDDQRGYLWISCPTGIYRVSKRELLEFANGARTSVSSLPFGTSDGLLNLRSNGGTMPAGMRSHDGKLWFPTQDGVAVIDPSRMPTTPGPPHVVIESALLDQVYTPTDTPLRVPPRKDNLEIHYTAPSFYKPEQIRFRYRLEGLDRDWVDVRNRRTAFYSHVPPGSYSFYAEATNASGTWGPESSRLSIVVLAPFYRTPWFGSLVALTISTAVMLAWRSRLAQMKFAQAQQLHFLQQLIASQENERKRIAAELHDSLGQRLVVINAVAQLSLRSHTAQPQTADGAALAEIREEAQAAIQDTHAIAYNLRPVHLDRFGLTKAILILVKEVSSASRVPITSRLDNVDDLLPDDQSINLYRIVQEALTNMVKYASATVAEVSIVRRHGLTVLTVKDNGVGFATERNLNKEGESGLGLRGMSERAALMGGSLAVMSAVGEGTVLTIELPAGDHKTS